MESIEGRSNCPGCGHPEFHGPPSRDPQNDRITCSRCGHSFEMGAPPRFAMRTAEEHARWLFDTFGSQVPDKTWSVRCPHCEQTLAQSHGAESIPGEETFCSYCGEPFDLEKARRIATQREEESYER